MKLKILFAFDNSTSISGITVYFNEINRIVNKYYKNGDKFYLWGSKYIEKSKTEIDEWIRNNRKGPDNIDSTSIAKLSFACPTHREHLIIVTDSKVSETCIRESDKLMKKYNIKFKFVSFYVIGTEGNLSVGAPFSRDCPNRVIHVIDNNKRQNLKFLSLEEIKAFDYIEYINSISEFDSKYDKLFSMVRAKQQGKKADNNIKVKLILLRNRLMNSVSGPKKVDFEEKWQKLFEMANNGVPDFKFGTAGIKR